MERLHHEMKKIILIDAGHGGLVNGEYITPGKRQWWSASNRISEGVLNRFVAHGLVHSLHMKGCNVHMINPENEDISLRARTIRANKFSDTHNAFLVSIHHNWYGDSNVRGFEIFTYYGESMSDKFAEIIADGFRTLYPDRKLRRHSKYKLSKEAGYWILRATRCPAVLVEIGFMSNIMESLSISDPQEIGKMVNFLSNQICFIYNKKM